MNSKILELLKETAMDAGLANQLRNCNTPDEVYKIASARVEGFTKQEFIEGMKEINRIIAENNQQRITKTDLNSLAKGSSTSTIVSAVSTYTGAAAAGAAAAAA